MQIFLVGAGLGMGLDLTRNRHQKIYSVFKLLQNSTLHSLLSNHHSGAMLRLYKRLFYCTLKPHNEVLMTNPDLSYQLRICLAR